jgi:hypothetical protein
MGFGSNLTLLQVVNSTLFALMWFEFVVVQDGKSISTITQKKSGGKVESFHT